MATKAETDEQREQQLEDEDEAERETETEPGTGVEPDTEGEPQVPEGFLLCPLCAGAGAVPDDVAAAPDSQTCETCHGRGIVTTGSLVPDRVTIPCTACAGNGYVTRRQEYQPPPPAPEPPPVYGPPPPAGYDYRPPSAPVPAAPPPVYAPPA